MKTKVCRDCRKREPLSEFSQLSRRCKACWAERRRQRYLKDRERVLEQWRAYYATHREEICADTKAWRKANPEYCKEHYRLNREKLLKYGHKYREAKKAQKKLVRQGWGRLP